jgi:homoserine O-acetyltransferase
MIDNPYYSEEIHQDFTLISIGRLELEEGGVIPECSLAVRTWGTLNEAKDNAILITTWYAGTHQVWADIYIGDNHALDPSRYFIVAINQIGNGLSTSPHNTDDPSISMSRFPHVRIGDDVVAQERLLREHFGIEHLALVVGGSMGAQQTYEWAVRFPHKVSRAAAIAGTAQNTPHDFLFTETLNEQIWSDDGWQGGEYSSNTEVVNGLHRQAHLWATMGFSTEFWKQEKWANLGFGSRDAFVSDFLEANFAVVDPNSLLTMAWKWQRGDVARHAEGDLAAALGRVTARTYVLPISEDMFFPVRDCAAEQAMIPNSELRVIDDIHGHLALWAFDPHFVPQIDKHLSDLLAETV